MDDNKTEIEKVSEQSSNKEEMAVEDKPLKQMLINYTGHKLKPENSDVSLEMIVGVLADEFPEVVLALAEENFIRGYKQALQDVDTFNKAQTTTDGNEVDAVLVDEKVAG